MKVNMNNTNVMISGKRHKGHRISEDGHMVLVVEVLVETSCSVQTDRNR